MSELIRGIVLPLDGVTLSLAITRKAIRDNTRITQEELNNIPDDVLYDAAMQTLDNMSKGLMSNLAMSIEIKAYDYQDRIEKERIMNMPKNDLPLMIGHEFESKENQEIWEKRLKS
jgi:hypothetical protein